MGKTIKISRIKLRDRYYNVVTGDKADLMTLSFALVNATKKKSCPVLVINHDANDILVANEKYLDEIIKNYNCKVCDMFNSCPVDKVLRAHKDNWIRIEGTTPQKEKPSESSKKYHKIKVE